MNISVQTGGKGERISKHNQYWSVMFVGDHGRIIPFRHFKVLTISVFVILIISIAACVVFGLLYYRQRWAYNALQYQIVQTDGQSSKLRDEKDLCLTELVALKKQLSQQTQSTAQERIPLKKAETPATILKVPNASMVKLQSSEPPAKEVKRLEEVIWSADIRNFDVSYDPSNRILKAQFRIYNTSKPKEPLAGNVVVVFKKQNDSDYLWYSVPSVPLNNGKPVGDKGESFKINNYMTVRFRITRDQNSPDFNLVSIYIFTKDGELIKHQDWPFNIDYDPTKPEPENTNENSSTEKSRH